MSPFRSTIGSVVFRVPPSPTASEGHVDYRLARASFLAEYEAGLVDRTEVCDAHPELKRAAREVGQPVPGECPICDAFDLTHCRARKLSGRALGGRWQRVQSDV